MRWNYIILRFLKCAETFLRMRWICAEALREMRWKFFVFTFTQNCLNFSTDVLNFRWNFLKNVLILYYFTFSQERWNFSTDLLKLCWNFAENALKFFCFHVFSKMLKLFIGSAEFALKLCEKYAEKSAEFFSWLVLKMRWNYIILRFLKSAETFLLICWICAETMQEMRSNFFCFHVFSKMLKLFIGSAKFARKRCEKYAEKSAEFFSWLVLKMRWNYIILRLLKSAEIFLRMNWICVETL